MVCQSVLINTMCVCVFYVFLQKDFRQWEKNQSAFPSAFQALFSVYVYILMLMHAFYDLCMRN